MKNIKILGILLFGVILINACGDNASDPVTYTNTISNDLNSCAVAGCHVSGFSFGSFANYDDAIVTISFGRILGALRHEDMFFPMPKIGEQWTEERVQRLEDWIKAGMPE